MCPKIPDIFVIVNYFRAPKILPGPHTSYGTISGMDMYVYTMYGHVCIGGIRCSHQFLLWLMFAGDDLSTNDVRHGISAVNYTPSGSSSSIAPSDFPAPPTESVSASLAHTEQVILHSEPPTAVPEDASTSHQVS